MRGNWAGQAGAIGFLLVFFSALPALGGGRPGANFVQRQKVGPHRTLIRQHWSDRAAVPLDKLKCEGGLAPPPGKPISDDAANNEHRWVAPGCGYGAANIFSIYSESERNPVGITREDRFPDFHTRIKNGGLLAPFGDSVKPRRGYGRRVGNVEIDPGHHVGRWGVSNVRQGNFDGKDERVRYPTQRIQYEKISFYPRSLTGDGGLSGSFSGNRTFQRSISAGPSGFISSVDKKQLDCAKRAKAASENGEYLCVIGHPFAREYINGLSVALILGLCLSLPLGWGIIFYGNPGADDRDKHENYRC